MRSIKVNTDNQLIGEEVIEKKTVQEIELLGWVCSYNIVHWKSNKLTQVDCGNISLFSS